MLDILCTLLTSHLEISQLNNLAPLNKAVMSSTLDTSHFEMSPLKASAFRKTAPISLIVDTSHSLIGPCGPSEVLFVVATALLSSALDCGENMAWPAQPFDEIDVNRTTKITCLNCRKFIGVCWYSIALTFFLALFQFNQALLCVSVSVTIMLVE